jgi:hypothetical protein
MRAGTRRLGEGCLASFFLNSAFGLGRATTADIPVRWLARRPVNVAIAADFPTGAASSIRPEIQISASAQ